MLRLRRVGRALVADKLSDAANLAAGAMVFGQFLGDRPFSPGLMVVGAAIWLGFVWCGVVLVERKD
jgi:hypothetical protein